MENYLPNKVPDTSNFRHAWNKLLDFLRRMQLQTSSDIIVTQGTHGTTLMVSDRIKKKISGGGTNVTWKLFEESASYSADTIVWVDPNKTYSLSFYTTNSVNFPPLSAGAFYVVNDVPTYGTGSRPSGNIYYPFYPVWDDSHTTTVSGSVKNQIYFRPINPLNIVSACINNETVQGFGQFIQSGSTYSYALPYP